MDLKEKVLEQFERNPQLRVLFFFDGNQSAADELDSWLGADIVTIKVEGQYFTLKHRLETELKNKKVFLYFSEQEPTDQQLETFPLVDLLVANKQLYIDPVMTLIEEFRLSPTVRNSIEKYHTELRHKNRRDFLASVLTPMSFTESALRRGLLCYHLNLKKISDYNLIAAQVFILALTPSEFETTLDKLRKLDLADLLNKILIDIFGDSFKELSLSGIKELASRLKYNLLMATIPAPVSEDQYSKLKEDNSIRVSRLMSLFHDWSADSTAKPKLLLVLDQLGAGIKEEKLISWYGVGQTFGFYTPSLKKRVLEECVQTVEMQPGKVKQTIKAWAEAPEEQDGMSPAIQYVWNAASLFEILADYKSFIFDSLSEYISRYERELYKIDMHYRKAEVAFQQALINNVEINLEKSIKALRDCYEKEFITPLNNEWMRCLKSFDFKLNSTTYSKQYNFYKDKVASKQQRTAVIISDAFRYEVARELAENLTKDSKNSAQVSIMLASIPSVTALGMANLLPNKEIQIVEKGFAINGISTESKLNRTKILQAVNPRSQAIDHNELISLDVENGREFIKQIDTLYIYHNKIDARGDEKKTERAVFEAAKEALDDLQIMVRKLNSWNVYRILITADHGFLASLRDVPETMKEDFPVVENEFMIRNRVIVGDLVKGASYQCLLSDTTNIKSDLQVGLPKSINRYRRQGAGVQYVHGGASLQELIVPVIEYSRMREDSSEKVKIRLMKFDERIASGYLKLNVLQLEPVNTGLKEMEAVVGLYSEQDELVSNEYKTLFNSTATNPLERNTEMVLTLSSKGTKLSQCILKGYDVDDEQRLNPLFNQRIMIQSLIQRDEFI